MLWRPALARHSSLVSAKCALVHAEQLGGLYNGAAFHCLLHCFVIVFASNH
jgi:hypothetical protein